jgi:hypothetical protein
MSEEFDILRALYTMVKKSRKRWRNNADVGLKRQRAERGRKYVLERVMKMRKMKWK